MLVTVQVGLAHVRPPTAQEFRKYVIEAESELAAELLACQWASASCEMPVSSKVLEVLEI